MSLVAEIIAKHLGEKENLDWRRIVQLLASYKGSTPDVRGDLSGLKDWEEEILCECANSLKKLESNYCRELDIFGLIGTEREVAERIKIEVERKREILPFLLENAR